MMDYILSEYFRAHRKAYGRAAETFLTSSILQRSHTQLILEVRVNLLDRINFVKNKEVVLFYSLAGNQLYYHGKERFQEVTPWERLVLTKKNTKEISCFDRDLILDALDSQDKKILGEVWRYGRRGGLNMDANNLIFDADDIIIHCLLLGMSASKTRPFAMVLNKKVHAEDADLFAAAFELEAYEYMALGREDVRTRWVCDEYKFLEILRKNPVCKTAVRIYSEMAERMEQHGCIRSWQKEA